MHVISEASPHLGSQTLCCVNEESLMLVSSQVVETRHGTLLPTVPFIVSL